MSVITEENNIEISTDECQDLMSYIPVAASFTRKKTYRKRR